MQYSLFHINRFRERQQGEDHNHTIGNTYFVAKKAKKYLGAVSKLFDEKYQGYHYEVKDSKSVELSSVRVKSHPVRGDYCYVTISYQ